MHNQLTSSLANALKIRELFMSTLVEPITKQSSYVQIEPKVILSNISWATYESLVTDLGNQSAIRLTYDRGILEIMSPLAEPEEINRTLAQFVEMLAEELNLDIERLGSTTFKREDLAKGFEPDSCYYIQNENKISGKKDIDLSLDPPPDLIIEIDITSSSIDKLPIYSKIGVLEVWRFSRKTLSILTLSNSQYIEVKTSLAFPIISSEVLNDFLEKSQTMKSTALSKSFREWIRKGSF